VGLEVPGTYAPSSRSDRRSGSPDPAVRRCSVGRTAPPTSGNARLAGQHGTWHTPGIETLTSFLTDPPPSPPVRALYEESLGSDGYVPNYVRLWCWRPEILEAFAELRADLLADSTLSPREVAVMVVSTASALGNSYCSLAWGEKLAEASDQETAAGVIQGVDTGLSEREAALAAWSRAVVADPNATTAAGVDRLRQAGLGEREIFEATTWIGFRLAFSTICDALGAQPDAELVGRVPVPVREAVSFGRRSDLGSEAGL
jgi:uncharacterized peroxidase-related enzyme